jgi:hypothetical protein
MIAVQIWIQIWIGRKSLTRSGPGEKSGSVGRWTKKEAYVSKRLDSLNLDYFAKVFAKKGKKKQKGVDYPALQ